MRLKVEADVHSEIYVDEVLKMKLHPFIIKLVPNEDGSLSKIVFERTVINYESMLPKVYIEHGQLISVEFPSKDFFEEEKKLMQHVESFGGLDLNIREINWDNPRITWIPESDEERLKVPILSYHKQGNYDKGKKKISLSWLQDTLIHRRMTSHLVLPPSFYRKGCNHYHRLEYIEAFLQFYLMLEGVFGEGQTKNQLVKKAFMNSENLDYGISQILNALEKSNVCQHKTWLLTLFNSKSWIYGKESVVKLLVEQRGMLSHYSIKSTRQQRSPFNDAEYHSLAFIAMMIAHFASIKLRLDPFRGKGI
jgi:hypothetical protein